MQRGGLLFFTGALATHVRARVFRNIAVRGAYLALVSRLRGPRDRPLTGLSARNWVPQALAKAVRGRRYGICPMRQQRAYGESGT